MKKQEVPSPSRFDITANKYFKLLFKKYNCFLKVNPINVEALLSLKLPKRLNSASVEKWDTASVLCMIQEEFRVSRAV